VTILQKNSSVQSIVRLDRNESGATTPTVLYGPDASKSRTSKKYRKVEKVVSRLMQAQEVFASSYMSRQKDGWWKDLGSNLKKSFKEGKKKAKFKIQVV
jgi:hypothetical protein